MTAEALSPHLSARGLAIGYRRRRGDAVVVAEGLDIDLNAGELVCLLGPNGAGKSTLIRTLVGMQPPLAASVRTMGRDIHGMTARELSQCMSVVLTDRVVVGSMTAYALVALGRYPYTNWLGRLTAEDEEVVCSALVATGAEQLASRHVGELSDGERQKVLIARALAQEAAVLVLDEPTAFLDLPRRVELMRLLRRLAHATGKAVLCSTHDLDLALRSADRLWLMARHGPMHTGAPEDMVLNGAFEQTFHADGVDFDRQLGSFRIHSPHGCTVALQGTGVAAVWSQRALERAGYSVVRAPSGDAALRVAVESERTPPAWRVQAPGCDEAADSIERLIELVRRLCPESLHPGPGGAPVPSTEGGPTPP